MSSAAGARPHGSARYWVRLYVRGNGARSLAAVDVVKRICEERLWGRYRLDVVELDRHLDVAEREGVVAAPTLVRREPAPVRRTVGNMTRDRVLAGLELSP